MEQDKKQTVVKFFKYRGSEAILAYFPNLNYNKRLYGNRMKSCYHHVGQHGACSTDYIKGRKYAKPEEYKDLKEELESIGYNLKILKCNE
jgi:hypothetical protein